MKEIKLKVIEAIYTLGKASASQIIEALPDEDENDVRLALSKLRQGRKIEKVEVTREGGLITSVFRLGTINQTETNYLIECGHSMVKKRDKPVVPKSFVMHRDKKKRLLEDIISKTDSGMDRDLLYGIMADLGLS